VESAAERLEEIVATSANINSKSLVLDVGCGIGGPTIHIAKKTGARIIGLNITRSQIEIAKKKSGRIWINSARNI